MTLLIPGASSVLNAKISPVVVYSICDSFLRRNEGQERVIGILLGSTDSNGTCHVRSCFTVIHSEQDGEVRPLFPLFCAFLKVLLQSISPWLFFAFPINQSASILSAIDFTIKTMGI